MVRGKMGRRGKEQGEAEVKDAVAATSNDSTPSMTPSENEEGLTGKVVGLTQDEEPGSEEEQRSYRELELLDKYQRLLAEFDNFRKRARREAEDQDRLSRGRLLLKILPVLDDYDRAQKSFSEGERSDSEALLTILRRLAEILSREGLEPIGMAVGDGFDPAFQEAIGALPSEEIPAQHVLDIFERGYHFDKRLLRPARVMVSTGPAATQQDEVSREEAEACDPEERSPDGTNRPHPDE
ncbi:MAG: nucleotide exchange factor GrpE [Candidatus Eisenbacteria bacterium]|nr:nucleotide exchange factor GrpE [Candidatus Eisenbacteria bacterium]MBU1949529.1 nucleotide exchange factor GrpE [Candidatus Eisenbacteria bacterium]